MKKRAILFAGQGAQVVGMGQDLYEASPEARSLYDQADAALGFSLSGISFQGPEEKLTDTSVCQPALYTHGLALLAALKKECPDFAFAAAAGLSLGEYTAHAAAGSFDFVTGLKLVQNRGRLMQEACAKTQGGMVSLIGATADQAVEVAREADLDTANFNCPGQIVLSGPSAHIPAAVAAAQKRGIKRAIPLKVAGAYHSRLMAHAEEALRPFLASASIPGPRVIVVANVTGEPVKTAEDIRASLARQVTGSVRWETCIRTLIGAGIHEFIELGPGGVLAGLLKRIDPAVPCLSVGTYAQLKDTLPKLA